MKTESNWALIGIFAVLLMISSFFLGQSVVSPTVDTERVSELSGELATAEANLANAQITIAELEAREVGNETIEVPYADASLFRDEALLSVLDEIGDEDDFLTCGDYVFNEDEVSYKLKDYWTYEVLDDDMYNVEFSAKWEFDDEKDIRACKETRTYSVLYEEGEDVVVGLLE